MTCMHVMHVAVISVPFHASLKGKQKQQHQHIANKPQQIVATFLTLYRAAFMARVCEQKHQCRNATRSCVRSRSSLQFVHTDLALYQLTMSPRRRCCESLWDVALPHHSAQAKKKPKMLDSINFIHVSTSC